MTKKQLINEAIGAASVCWTEVPRGTFDSEQATNIADKLIGELPPDYIGLVSEFHTTFQHPIETLPVLPDRSRMDLRYNLLKEEVGELAQAINENDIVKITDALCDIQYVLSGAVLEFGLWEKFPSLFQEVHRSNMSKACSTIQEAVDTCEDQQQNHNEPCTWTERNGKYFVTRNRDGKTIKSINYSRADLEGVLFGGISKATHGGVTRGEGEE